MDFNQGSFEFEMKSLSTLSVPLNLAIPNLKMMLHSGVRELWDHLNRT